MRPTDMWNDVTSCEQCRADATKLRLACYVCAASALFKPCVLSMCWKKGKCGTAASHLLAWLSVMRDCFAYIYPIKVCEGSLVGSPSFVTGHSYL